MSKDDGNRGCGIHRPIDSWFLQNHKTLTAESCGVCGGEQTEKSVDAELAFSDDDQAKAQLFYFEKKGSAAEKKLARLAYREYQGKRFRQGK